MLIPAYRDKDILGGPLTKEYVENYARRTTKASNPIAVFLYIKKYLRDNACTPEVQKFLRSYMVNVRLMLKTHVVHDGSYRNFVVLVRPDGARITDCGDLWKKRGYGVKVAEQLRYARDHAQIVFLNMTSETWKEVDAWNRLYRW
jgi:hypothetical protein